MTNPIGKPLLSQQNHVLLGEFSRVFSVTHSEFSQFWAALDEVAPATAFASSQTAQVRS